MKEIQAPVITPSMLLRKYFPDKDFKVSGG
jgi:hypothetical protein